MKNSNYELLCLFPNEEKNRKEEIIKKIKSLEPQNLEVKEFNAEKLEMSYLKIAKSSLDNYLLLDLSTNSEKARQIEGLFKQSAIQYLLINKDREKRLKIKGSPNRLDNTSNKEEKQIIYKEE